MIRIWKIIWIPCIFTGNHEYICNSLIEDTHHITSENYQQEIESMRSLAYEITDELVKPYEDVIKVDLYDH